MAVRELWSRRKRWAEQGGPDPDVYTYDDIPPGLRTQIVQIWQDAIGPFYRFSGYEMDAPPRNNRTWIQMHDAFAKEKALKSLGSHANPFLDCEEYLQGARPIDDILDIIEFSFRVIQGQARLHPDTLKQLGVTQSAESAIKELNFRFREAGVGYRFEGRQIVRVDSQLIHQEAVKPALRLLSARGFEGANAEYFSKPTHITGPESMKQRSLKPSKASRAPSR